MSNSKQSPDAFDWAYEKYIANDPEEVRCYQEEKRKADIGQVIYDLRTKCGFSEEQLGEEVGVSAQVIHKLEVADYEGPYEEVFQRITDIVCAADDRLIPQDEGEGSSLVRTAGGDSAVDTGSEDQSPA